MLILHLTPPLSWTMKTARSKAVKGDVDMNTHVGITDMVYDIHRRSHHYSLKKRAPESYEALLRQINDIPIAIVQQAFDIYSSSKPNDDKVPHPNYFLAICKRLQKEQTKKENPGSGPWGKVI